MIDKLKTEVLKTNPTLTISIGKDRFDKKWKVSQMELKDFLKRLENPTVTQESVLEFLSMTKAQKEALKDVGGFVGGGLKNGRRNAQSVANRQIITLDADECKPNIFDRIKKVLNGKSYTIYSTRKHTKEKPRLRVLVYLDRPVIGDEYEAIARKLAYLIDIEQFDDTTYQPHRMMFFPSISRDGEYLFEHNDGSLSNANSILDMYDELGGWQDTSMWHTSSRVNDIHRASARKAGNPLEKKGITGAFNRVYSIRDVIDNMLSDIYKKGSGDRYTYTEGTSANGLVIYEELFAYSNHSTDPISGKLCNAFDLYRIHKFGELDEDFDTSKKYFYNQLPSYKAMAEMLEDNKAVKVELVKYNMNKDNGEKTTVKEEKKDSNGDIDSIFGESVGVKDVKSTDEWIDGLEITDKGVLKTTFLNSTLIMENDEEIKDLPVYNEFTTMIESSKSKELWKDTDELKIRKYIGKKYKIDLPEAKVSDAIKDRASQNSYHPVKQYLNDLEWDGVKRLERLFIDYLHTEDSLYTRETAKCMMLGAVNRIFKPGYKFDNMVVLEGLTGARKSSFINMLAVRDDWFAELNTFETSKATETITGRWIVEIPELTAVNKHDSETQKSFLSARSVVTRLAYKKNTEEYKRQTIFIGTTNRKEYLKDMTGNRRYWPISLGTDLCEDKPIDLEMLSENIDQIWAEAMELYFNDEPTTLSYEARIIAKEMQDGRMEEDVWIGMIEAYISERDKVCVSELWAECLNMTIEPKRADNVRISAIMDNMKDFERSKSPLAFEKYGRQRAFIRSF